MNIDSATLDKIANLARLEIKDSERTTLIQSLENVLSWMEQLNDVDTTGVAPLTHISEENNRWREDVGQNSLLREEALANAPSKNNRYIKVPKVIE
tara:strand:- start:15 stop:302 length:288 start_codon:yes stop_codon:yes gene_type:complete